MLTTNSAAATTAALAGTAGTAASAALSAPAALAAPAATPAQEQASSASASEDEDEVGAESSDSDDMDSDPFYYLCWAEEKVFVQKVFLEVWNHLPGKMYPWLEVLDAVKLRINQDIMDEVKLELQVEDKALDGIEDDLLMYIQDALDRLQHS
ncbi:hypothetical protein B0H14DRAFT_2599026 [Mycena olivaceomarginata]|nr:hypothetical protein B0H14DRAFT_2599026 [Mycena olivaceomarginata]